MLKLALTPVRRVYETEDRRLPPSIHGKAPSQREDASMRNELESLPRELRQP
jgi:hypothetical protein